MMLADYTTARLVARQAVGWDAHPAVKRAWE